MYLASQRKEFILKTLAEHGAARTIALAKQMKVTDETVRNDLINLEKRGFLKRVHGGALAALADTVGGAATFAAYRRGCVTVNYSMNFLRPAWGSNRKIRCRAQAVKLGRTLSVFGMSLTDDEGMEVASGNFTFYITGWMKSEEEKEPGAI